MCPTGRTLSVGPGATREARNQLKGGICPTCKASLARTIFQSENHLALVLNEALGKLTRKKPKLTQKEVNS